MSADERVTQLTSQVLSISTDVDLFDDPGTPQSKALKWLIEEDDLVVCPSSTNLEQRYILAVFYFETFGPGWSQCTLGTPCDGEEWLSGVDECQWGGIECGEGSTVTAIHRDESRLTGGLPTEIGKLTFLVHLDLDSNNMTAPMPSTLGQLLYLETLDLDQNDMVGSIPDELYDAVSLRVIDLDGNSLTGTISSRIGLLPDLYFVQLDDNSMTGPIPSEIGDLSNLSFFSIFQNNFSGSVPTELCEHETVLYADCSVCLLDNCCTACLE